MSFIQDLLAPEVVVSDEELAPALAAPPPLGNVAPRRRGRPRKRGRPASLAAAQAKPSKQHGGAGSAHAICAGTNGSYPILSYYAPPALFYPVLS
jgi:hypothetical protein